ncbi:MAG: glycerophosphodiester phosphodiesterase [Candidatus Thorarchaeota archaeon]|nr:glycerophosphodiester phosphodiesterase [Candidatus Thorarchaeota archaeon]
MWRVRLITNQLVIAHKGASGYFPENTILSFKNAWNMGAHMIELDVHETLDGKLVCIHDSTVERTTNGTGAVHALDYRELAEFDAGNGESVPLLEDVLKFAFGRLQVNIELKVIGVEQEVINLVERHEMVPNILVSSFLHATLQTIYELNESIATAILVKEPIEDIISYALGFNVNAVNPHHRLITRELVEDLHSASLKVYPWTVNDSPRMKTLYSLGVDGVVTDYPDKAVDVLKAIS